MAGLGDMFGASFATVNGQKPRNSENMQPGQPLNMRSAFEAAQNIPVLGDAISGGMAVYDYTQGDNWSAGANALAMIPGVSGMVVPKKVQEDILSRLIAFKNGESPGAVVKNGLVQTKEQTEKLNAAFSQLTGGKQPPYEHKPIDINLGHIYDSRVSGQIKPSGKMADAFAPEKVTQWIEAAGEDASVVSTKHGKPALTGAFMDQTTGEKFDVHMPISGDFSTGRLWVSGLIPDGKFTKKKP